MVPSVRHEHEDRPVLVLVDYHEQTIVTFTTEIVDPPPPSEQVTVREVARTTQRDRRPPESGNYAERSIANGYTLIEYAPTDPQHLFPTYYREETQTITVDPTAPHESRSSTSRRPGARL